MTTELDGKENIIISSDELPNHVGALYLHRDVAEKLAMEILDAVQASYDAEPPAPVYDVTYAEWKAGIHSDDNVRIIDTDMTVTLKCPRIVSYP